MKLKIQQLLHLISAAVIMGAAFGLNSLIAALSLSAISVGFAASAWMED